jgi:hypothetical protein
MPLVDDYRRSAEECLRLAEHSVDETERTMLTCMADQWKRLAEYTGQAPRGASVQDGRELYRSPNGDAWFLCREAATGRPFVLHEPNQASGGRSSRMDVGQFLRPGSEAPEQQALLRLIATLSETDG